MIGGAFSSGFSPGFAIGTAAACAGTPITVTVTVEGLPAHKRVTTTVSISDTE